MRPRSSRPNDLPPENESRYNVKLENKKGGATDGAGNSVISQLAKK